MEALRVGVVGLGFIGELHSRVLHEVPNAVLVAVADIDETLTSSIAGRYGCTGYTDYQEMIRREKLDAVSICTPDPTHQDTAVSAARAGLHILLEKPIANTREQAESIKQAVEAAGVRLMVAHLLHFDPRYAILEQSIKNGEIGDTIHLYFRRTNPRGNGRRLGGKVSIFWYIGIHDFEMMLACAGSKPTRAYARKVSKLNADIRCEDSVFSMVEFANGAIGVVELSWALPENPANGINTYAEVVGASGAGYVNIFDQGITVVTDRSLVHPDILNWPEYNGQILGNLKDEIQHFVNATLAGEPYITDTDNAIAAVGVVEACLASIERGVPVGID